MSPILESVLVRLGDATARITVLLLLVLAAALLLRRAAALLRHRLWAGALVLVLVMPLASVLLPPLALPVLRAPPPPALPAALPSPPWLPMPPPEDSATSIRELVHAELLAGRFEGTAIRRLDIPLPPPPPASLAGTLLVPLALALWLVGVGVVARRTVRARRAARRLLVGSLPADPVSWPGLEGLAARESEAIDLPITVGALRPLILLPRAGRLWPIHWRRAAVGHEVAHVRQRDPMLQLLAELLTALYWFHPLVHLAARQLRIERELTADDSVLLAGHRSSEYAQLLVTLACAPDTPPAAGAVVPLLTPAGLKARLTGILDASRPRLARRLPALLLGAAAVLAAVPLAAAIPVQRPLPPSAGPAVARVLDEVTGKPVAGAEVDFVMRDGTVRVVSAADGTVRRPIPPRDPSDSHFVLYARLHDRAARKAVNAIPFGSKLPVDLTLRPGASLRGTVRSPGGEPVAGAEMHIIRWQATSVGPGGGALATTDRTGAFALGGLLYGSYTLLAVAPSGATSSAIIKVGAGDPRPVALTVVDEDTVSGRLRDADGRPLVGVRIERLPRYFNGGSRPASAARHADWDVTGDDGRYRMLPLGGTLFARAEDQQGHIIEALFSDGGLPHVLGRAHGTELQPTRPATVILQRPAVIAAKVRWSDGVPADRASILLHAPALDAANGPLRNLFTGSDGYLPPLAVPPGIVRLVARYHQLNPDGSYPGQTVTLTLAPGQRRDDIEITLPRHAPVP